MTATYAYGNVGPAAASHHSHLATVCDGHTTEVLSRLRTPLAGARVLEVGAGAGSIAVWLAEQVGPDGQVLAIDLDPMPMPDHPQLQVRQHNIVTQPVPGDDWDIIHVRLLLMHLPQRVRVLHALAAALTGGGVLVVEDWDQTWRDGRVLCAPTEEARKLWCRYHDALLSVHEEAGVDGGWACGAAASMAEAGLVDISAHIHSRSWAGGTGGARLAVTNINQLHSQLRAHGLSDDDLAQVIELASHPKMLVRTPLMVSTVGYKP